jgi:hypothetical protein
MQIENIHCEKRTYTYPYCCRNGIKYQPGKEDKYPPALFQRKFSYDLYTAPDEDESTEQSVNEKQDSRRKGKVLDDTAGRYFKQSGY